MDDMARFEGRLEARVRAFALSGTRPVDAAAVARAVAARRIGGSTVSAWRGLLVPRDRRVAIAVATLGLLLAALMGAMLVGSRLLAPRLPANGWIAFTVGYPPPGEANEDFDIWFVALDKPARRVVGDDSDRIHQLCPAFSPDALSLAYGRVEAEAASDLQPGYRRAALVVADVREDGSVVDRLTVDVGDGLPPPCAVWSPDGKRVAFGVNRTSPINPDRPAAGSEVWIVATADLGITILPDLLATDLEWSPDGSALAIASGADEMDPGSQLRDGLIHLYWLADGLRTLADTDGALDLMWSRDGRSLVYSARNQLHVVDVATGIGRPLTEPYSVLHGIGPVLSPDGRTIAYQRGLSGEHSELVLLTPGDVLDPSAASQEVVLPVTTGSRSDRLDPYRATWSPDGQYLLMMAWGHPPDAPATVEDPFFVAVPIDPTAPAVMLYRTSALVVYEGYDDTTFVPIQTWARATSP